MALFSPAGRRQNTAGCSLIYFSSFVFLISLFLVSSPAPAGETAAAPAEADTVAVPPPAKSTMPVVISVSVNTVPQGDFFMEIDDEGNLMLKASDLDALHLRFDGKSTVVIRDERYVPAAAVLDARAVFDEKKLSLSFTGKTTEARQTNADIFQLTTRPYDVYYPKETSFFLNYGFSYGYTRPSGDETFSLTNKLGARTGDMFFVSDSLYSKTGTDRQFVRLQTSATYERRDDLQWLTVGDQFTRSGDFGSSLNMGGIGFSKVFRLDPYLITQPVFDLTGSVIYPTQAEIFLDGMLVGKQQIAPGNFDLRNIYSYNGIHRVEVVLRDPFGQERRIAYPVYFNNAMLRAGLHEYSYNLGFLRERYGVLSNEYGEPAFSAFHRYGVTNSLNIGVHAEGSDGVYNGGLSTSFLLARLGAVTLAGAATDAKGVTGSAGLFQHSYQVGNFNTSVRARGFSRYYATVSVPSPSPQQQIKQDANVSAGFLLQPLGSLSLNYAAAQAWDGGTTRGLSANYSRTLSRIISLYATASELRQPDRVLSFFIGLNFSFDNTLRGAAHYTKTGDTNAETVQIQKDVPVGEGAGYRATVTRIDSGRTETGTFNPFVQYNGPYGIYTLDASARSSAGSRQEAYTASASGAIVYAGGFYAPARPVSDSFSIVMLDNVARARVLNNGQEIGATGASGTLVVPTLASYGRNQITVDVKNLPMEYSISGVNKALSPSLWSGSCIAFDAVKMQAVTGNLVAEKDGTEMPLEYVEISVAAGEKILTFPTGRDGEFYIENTLPKDPAEGVDQQSCAAIVRRRKSGEKAMRPGVYPAWTNLYGRKCEFKITFPETEDVITSLGKIECGKSGTQTVPASPVEPQKPAQSSAPAPVQPAPRKDVKPTLKAAVTLVLGKNGTFEGKDRRAVASLGRQLGKDANLVVVIEVHAPLQGRTAASRFLALKQADAIRKYLLSNGVKADRIRKTESADMACPDASPACEKAGHLGFIQIILTNVIEKESGNSQNEHTK